MVHGAPPDIGTEALLVGFGLANRGAAAALLRRGHRVVVVDDRPTDSSRTAAHELDLDLVEAPDPTALARLVASASVVVPTPGLPDAHPLFPIAADTGVPVVTEFDLAAAWDRRPVVAVTGTNGKTTVTALVAGMLMAAGHRCAEAGNTDVPLVSAIDDPDVEWFVVEASSFRLGRTHGWAPEVGTWLNLAPDHLDVHASLDVYEAAKAQIWASQRAADVAVGNADDPVVAGHLTDAPARRLRFSVVDDEAEFCVVGGALRGPGGPIVDVADLPRRLPHDLSNALAAAASAHGAGVDDDAIARTLASFDGLPHRVATVATVDGVRYVDDSKATVPHAALTAMRAFDTVVLIAGGRNKGLDLRVLAEAVDRVRAVVAIGDAAREVAAAFEQHRPVQVAHSMDDAVAAAQRLAVPGDVVLLSPACASYDWYANFAERGDDFARAVRALPAGPSNRKDAS